MRGSRSKRNSHPILQRQFAFEYEMRQSEQHDKIVLVSRDPNLTDVRKRVLEHAGFAVIPVADESEVQQTCRRERVRLIMLGQSLSPSEKRRVWVAAKEQSNVPILELYHSDGPELLERNVFTHHSQQPDDFLDSVRKVLNEPHA